jgi:hypothetical protein
MRAAPNTNQHGRASSRCSRSVSQAVTGGVAHCKGALAGPAPIRGHLCLAANSPSRYSNAPQASSLERDVGGVLIRLTIFLAFAQANSTEGRRALCTVSSIYFLGMVQTHVTRLNNQTPGGAYPNAASQ